MNIYKGCCHGCIYCDSRSECYRVDRFDEVRAKENALSVIERDLKSKRKRGLVMTGSMSDPYNPFEEKELLTRGALELIDKYTFGIVIATKSDLVTRDSDCLLAVKKHSPAAVNFTITCFEDELCAKVERNVCPSSRRFEAIKKLTEIGINCGVILMPILPFINDTEENIGSIIKCAAKAGAKWVYPGHKGCFSVTLRQNQRQYFYDRLNESFPGIKKLYIKKFGTAYECNSSKAKELWPFFTGLCDEHGLLYSMNKIAGMIKGSYTSEQMSLF